MTRPTTAPSTRCLRAAVLPALLALLALPAPRAAAAGAQALDCLIQPNQVVQVGTPVAGVVESVGAERGDVVRRGQVLVQLSARVERAALAMARERAEQVGELSAANGAQDLARRELSRAHTLFGENFVSRTYVDKAQAEAAVAGGRTEQAQERRRLAERELALAEAQLAQRTIRSPIDGVVVDRLVAPGEYVEQRPLLRIASVDPLRVDVLVPSPAFGQVQVGTRARVTPELANAQPLVAEVRTVDRVIDAASNTFRVRLELRNTDGALPAGLRCKADLGVAGASTAAAPAPGRTAGAALAAPAPAPAQAPTRPAASLPATRTAQR